MTEEFDLELSAVQEMAKRFPDAREEDLRKVLGSMGLHGNLALLEIRKLSGGQKSRIALAAAAMQQPHILLLDEPTSHLDIGSVDALLEALHEYAGGVVVVSHDRHFVNSVNPTEVWLAKDGQIQRTEEW